MSAMNGVFFREEKKGGERIEDGEEKEEGCCHCP